MLKQYKKHLIFSSLGILLPTLFGLLFWNQLPDSMATHWGVHGEADGFSGKAFAVFGLPLILLVFHWLCLFFTQLDPKNKDRNHKPFLLVLWIMPVLSVCCTATVYCAALGYTLHIGMIALVPMGLMFVAIGNYLPKCQQNHTIGIKITWTLANEENWNLTHRFGGKCWVIGGVIMMLCAFLPGPLGVFMMFAAIAPLVLLPVLYSWRIYRRHKQQGIDYPKAAVFGSKKATGFSAVMLVVLLVFISWLMFTGDITYSLGDNALTIEADFYTDLTVSYDSMDSIEFIEGNVPGVRTAGFQSARLLMGIFQNEEFGSYTRYTYTSPDGCILIRSGDKILVLSTEHYSQTLKLYLQLQEAVSKS